MDRRLLRIIIEDYDGGPVGVETIAAALAEPRDTIEDVYEPYLLQTGSSVAPPAAASRPRRPTSTWVSAKEPSADPPQGALLLGR